jgi:hypothetical protein
MDPSRSWSPDFGSTPSRASVTSIKPARPPRATNAASHIQKRKSGMQKAQTWRLGSCRLAVLPLGFTPRFTLTV